MLGRARRSPRSEPTSRARSTVWIASNSAASSACFSSVTSREARVEAAARLGARRAARASRRSAASARVAQRARLHLAREHDRRGRAAADHRRERALDGGGAQAAG